MILKEFQVKAIKEIKKGIEQNKEVVVLDSPTGSGKTIILVHLIEELYKIYDNKVVVWFTPGAGDLEEQSQQKMEKIFPNSYTQTLDDILLQGFKKDSTVFINWERVTKDDNIARKDGERDNLRDKVERAKKQGIEFIIIIDEEHKNDTKKAKEVITLFEATTQIRASATPESFQETEDVQLVKITDKEVIREGLISKAIHINEGVYNKASEIEETNDIRILLDLAIEKREAIHKRYKEMGKEINPMVLIQLPNAKKTVSEEDKETVSRVEKYLEEKGITYTNKGLAKWLSAKEDKINIAEDDLGVGNNIKDSNAEPMFLIMKQAISTGWDAPRAKILVKLRQGSGDAFTVQTIGRIRRMPEGNHYDEDILDNCYLYTFDEKYQEGLLTQLKDLTSDVKKIELKPEYKDIVLKKELKVDKETNLAETALYKTIKEGIKEKYKLEGLKRNKIIMGDSYGYNFSIEVEQKIPEGKIEDTRKDFKNLDKRTHKSKISLTNNGQDFLSAVGYIDDKIHLGYEFTTNILRKLFTKKVGVRDRILSLSLPEFYAFVILNKDLLREVMYDTLYVTGSTAHIITAMNEIKEETDFKLETESLLEYNKRISSVEYNKNVYEGYVSSAIRSKPESLFERYCESSSKIEWWYKNGEDKNKSFSLVYELLSRSRYFFPDYILKDTEGNIWIIETKGGEDREKQNKDIDKLSPFKFEALKKYASDKGIKFGFVRDIDGIDLKINTTEYVADLDNSEWVLIQDIL